MPVNKTEVINFSSDKCDWKVIPLTENIQEFTKLGLIKNNEMRNKLVFERDGERFVMKQNSFTPHKSPISTVPKLDISTSVNEFVLIKLINNISNRQEFKNLKDYFLDVNLHTIVSPSNKGTKLNTKLVSSTKLTEGLYSIDSINAHHKEIAEALGTELKTVPTILRCFMALVGNKIQSGNLLKNIEGDVKMIDLGDSDPKLIEEYMNTKFIPFLNSQSLDDKLETISTFLSLITAGIEETEQTIIDVKSIYDKINIEFNPEENSRTSGMRLYQKLWMHLIPYFNNVLMQLEDGNISLPILQLDYNTLLTTRVINKIPSVNKLKTSQQALNAKQKQNKIEHDALLNKNAIKEDMKSNMLGQLQGLEESLKPKSYNLFDDEEELDNVVEHVNEQIKKAETFNEEALEETFEEELSPIDI